MKCTTRLDSTTPAPIPEKLDTLRKSWILGFIHEIQQYETTFCFKATDNFKKFSSVRDPYKTVYYQRTTDMAFSQGDPRLSVVRIGSEEKPEARPSYEMYVYENGAFAGDTLITKAMLKDTPFGVARTVIHEDCHENLDLPRDVEEATCSLISASLAAEFVGVPIDKILQKELVNAILVNKCYEELLTLATLYRGGRITEDEYNKKKAYELLISGLPYANLNAPLIAHLHTYDHYYPLVYDLFYYYKSDAKKFIEFLSDMSVPDPKFDGNHEEHFIAVRAAEFEIELRINAEIERLKASRK